MKEAQDNNLYMYCDNKSHKVEVCFLYLSRTTKLYARHTKAVSFILETTLAT